MTNAEFIGAVLYEMGWYERQTAESPTDICISLERYKKLDAECSVYDPSLARSRKTDMLCGLKVHCLLDMHGDEFFMGKLRHKAEEEA